MSVNLRYPNITAGTEREQLSQIKSFLHQLVDQLNYALPSMDGASQSIEVQGSEISYYELRSLIMQNLDKIEAEFEKLSQKMTSEYVPKSGWGADKDIVTDASGNVVEADHSGGGSAEAGYVFTGRVLLNDDGEYVDLDDNYSWDKLVAASNERKYVGVILRYEIDGTVVATFCLPLINGYNDGNYGSYRFSGIDSDFMLRELYIAQDSVYWNIYNVASEELVYDVTAGKLDAYVFTGQYIHNEDNTYDATLDDNYNWYDLVYAIQENKVVSCVLWDEDRLYPMFLTAFAPMLDDGYVVFTALAESGDVRELYVSGDGGLSLRQYDIATREYVDNAGGGERAYIITGIRFWDEDAGEDVVTFDNFDWDELINALDNGCRVAVRLSYRGDIQWLEYAYVSHYTSEWYDTDEEYGGAFFQYLADGLELYGLWIYRDGTTVFCYADLMSYESVGYMIDESTENIMNELKPIISTTDITAGSAAPNGRPYHVIE